MTSEVHPTVQSRPASPAAPRPKKKLVRRVIEDPSQRIRRTIQIAFLVLNLVSGRAVLLVRAAVRDRDLHRHLTPAGSGGLAADRGTDEPEVFPGHGPDCLDSSRRHVSDRDLPGHVAAACGRASAVGFCPVGTLSEWLWKFGRKTFRRNWALPALGGSIPAQSEVCSAGACFYTRSVR